MTRFPKLTTRRESDACRYLHSMQRVGLEPFALAWIYDQTTCRFTLLVVAAASDEAGDRAGRYQAAVRAILGGDRDAPQDILAIDDKHPWNAALRKALPLLRRGVGSFHALKMGPFVLLSGWVVHIRAARPAPPPKWRWDRVEHALAA